MSRRGRAVSGWLVIDKPAGITSTGCVGRARWALAAAKAGHAGTLDPDATGVLAVAFGEATKTVPFIAEATKTYRFRVRFGAATTTDDAAGDIIARADARPATDAIEAALGAFRGTISQVPPRVSAIRVAGARAYDLAREGADFTLAARPIEVTRLVLVGRPDRDHADLEMDCGKGGYVRGIARDLGAALGCLGHALWLRRTRSGPFRVEDALAFDRLEALARTPDLDALLLPLETALAGVPERVATAQGALRLRHGNPGALVAEDMPDGRAWASHDGRAVAVGHARGDVLHPERVFHA